MKKQPPYFQNVEQRTIRRWKQLDADPELAAPWKQLFKQVRSPQHVISELLQNADDAGATEAWIRVDEGVFSFSHNGEDFTEDQFASLCRFGYSNKRSLHTIGFRGIGFKSTFSIGDEVHLLGPTLGVTFHAKQFTRPVWNGEPAIDGKTTVRISIKDKAIEKALLGSIKQWVTSPVSILFFKNLKEVHFNGTHVQKHDDGIGPTESSTRFKIRVDGKTTQELLLIESEDADFPEDAVQEIREERNLDSEEFSMPPCKLEVVLGLTHENRFFVVLPTGYEPDLPFSVNAPFLQDPARFGIKDPETSPTNQWLIQRTGELVAETFTQWITNEQLSLEERSRAYGLCPVDSRSRNYWSRKPFDYAEETIRQSFYSLIEDHSILSLDGDVHPAEVGISIPDALHDVWSNDILKQLFASNGSVLLSRFVPTEVIRELSERSWIDVYEDSEILDHFKDWAYLPKPMEWDKLSKLWEYAEGQSGRSGSSLKELPLHPVKGDNRLAAGNQVIRTATRFERFSKADASFLLGNVKEVDHDWLEWITQRKKEGCALGYADRVISLCGLNEPARAEFLATQAANNLFAIDECDIEDVVRLAHIFASIDAELPESFHYVCKDDTMRKPSEQISLADQFGIDERIPLDWFDEHCLHEDYYQQNATCSSEAWYKWAKSKKSRLWLGLPLVESILGAYSKRAFENLIARHGGHPPKSYQYKREDFELLTYDFPEELRRSISNLGAQSNEAWSVVLQAILEAPDILPKEAFEATAYQIGNKYKQRLECGKIVPSWIIRFQAIPCLPDSQGNLHVPSELMLRTPDTEAVRDIEKFIQADFDNHQTFPILKALGVRTTPSDFQTVIDRIKAFLHIPEPTLRLAQLQKLYEALDRISLRCDSDAMAKIADQFATQNLILTEAATWANSRIVSIHPDVEGSQQEESIHSLFRHYGLWQRIGVSPTPSIERAIEWINELPKGQKLPSEDIQRLRTYLKRDPERIWQTTGHWLAMDGSWSPVGFLEHRITMQSLFKTTDLFPDMLKVCADLRALSNEQLEQETFIALPDLGTQIELRTTQVVEATKPKGNYDWICCLGSYLSRVLIKDDARRERIQQAGARMVSSQVVTCNVIEVTPFLEAKPAGPSRKVNVAWEGNRFFVLNHNPIHLLDDLEKEISRVFDDPEMRDVLKVCMDRDGAYISEYLSNKFEFELVTENEPESLDADQGGANEPDVDGADEDGQTNDNDLDEPDATADEDLEDDDTPNAEEDADNETGDDEWDDEPDEGQDKEPAKPKVDPRFETLKGHLKDRGFVLSPKSEVFTHQDGSSVQKKTAPFHCWEETGSSGELVCRYWFAPKNILEGVEMPAELWTLIHQSPANYQIVEPLNGTKATITQASDIVDGVNDHWVKVFPTRYLVRAEQN